MAVIDKEKVRQWLGVNDWVPGSGMPLLDVIVDASINAIADACGRTFDVVDGDTAATARYLTFLAAGGSKYPIDLLRDAGVDMTTDEPLTLTMAKMSAIMDEIEGVLDRGVL